MNPTNHQSTHDEPRALLRGLEGKGSREVLAGVDQSHLGSALVQATLGTVALMTVLTVVPYLLSNSVPAGDGKIAVQTPEPAEQPETVKVEPKPDDPMKTADPSARPPVATTNAKKGTEKQSDDVLNKLKENETKTGTPKDPFGTNLDDLLKDK